MVGKMPRKRKAMGTKCTLTRYLLSTGSLSLFQEKKVQAILRFPYRIYVIEYKANSTFRPIKSRIFQLWFIDDSYGWYESFNIEKRRIDLTVYDVVPVDGDEIISISAALFVPETGGVHQFMNNDANVHTAVA